MVFVVLDALHCACVVDWCLPQATSISPWVITLEALEAFRCEAPPQDPPPLPYLAERRRSTFDVRLTASLTPQAAGQATTLTRTNLRHL